MANALKVGEPVGWDTSVGDGSGLGVHLQDPSWGSDSGSGEDLVKEGGGGDDSPRSALVDWGGEGTALAAAGGGEIRSLGEGGRIGGSEAGRH